MSESLFRTATEAMATRFEFALHGGDEIYLRAAAEEAMAEILRLEKALSFYSPGSIVSRINREAFHHPVRVTPQIFQLLEQSIEISNRTTGLFDITVAPLIELWNTASRTGTLPGHRQVETILQSVGAQHIQLDLNNFSVSLTHPDTRINLGSIGKGYALQCAFEILMDLEVPHGLIQGGTSSIIAWGNTPEEGPWKIGIQSPENTREYSPLQMPEPSGTEFLEVVELDGKSLAVSSIWGRGFHAGGRYLGHVIHPATGWPVGHSQLCALTSPDAATADALTTAMIAAETGDVPGLAAGFPDASGFVFHSPEEPLTRFP